MRLTKTSIAVLGLFLAAFAARAEDKDGWVNLLEAKKLDKHFTTKGNWNIDKEGVVQLQPRPGESGWQRYDAYLWAKGEFTDFEADFEYKVNKGGNSGFYFHVGKIEMPVATGIEVQIYDSGNKKPGDKLTDHDSGGVIPGIAPTKSTAKPAGEWNRMQITCKGKTLAIRLNGEVVNEVDLDNEKLKARPKSGSIGFQDHGVPLWLRNIRLRELK